MKVEVIETILVEEQEKQKCVHESSTEEPRRCIVACAPFMAGIAMVTCLPWAAFCA